MKRAMNPAMTPTSWRVLYGLPGDGVLVASGMIFSSFFCVLLGRTGYCSIMRKGSVLEVWVVRAGYTYRSSWLGLIVYVLTIQGMDYTYRRLKFLCKLWIWTSLSFSFSWVCWIEQKGSFVCRWMKLSCEAVYGWITMMTVIDKIR